MRKTYSVIAWIIAGGVVVQAASVAFGLGGMMRYVHGGGVIDMAVIESGQVEFTGAIGLPVHETVGGLVLPVLALALLVISLFVTVPRGKTAAALLFALVLVQVMAGYSIKDLPYLGLLHGANALAVLVMALVTARLAHVATPASVNRQPTDVAAGRAEHKA